MPTLYLHIGRGKTGTTLIQKHLAERREDLLDRGVHYIAADGGDRGDGHQQFAKSFVTAAPKGMLSAARPEEVRKAVADELSQTQADVVLMSSENFAIAEIAPLADFLRGLRPRYKIKIIFFVRSQDELTESEYNQVTKLIGLNVSLTEYANSRIEGCDFFEVAEDWAAHFGRENIICRVYDGRARNVVSKFLECIPEIDATGLSAPGPARNKSAANTAIGIRALWIARILNSVDLERRFHSYQPVFSLLADKDIPALLWNSQQAARYRERFSESNLAFSERYLDAPRADLGGRRYTDAERDQIIEEIAALRELLPGKAD